MNTLPGSVPPLLQPAYDLVVIGGTPGGIACAVRAAREGLSVLLVNRHEHLGGILSSGLAVWDTLWEGHRSPIYDEVRQAIFDYYRTTHGEDSQPYRDCLPSSTGHLVGRFEARVAEKILTDLVSREANITVLNSHVPTAVGRHEALLDSMTLQSTRDGNMRTVSADTYADCTYEGDLAALAGAPYRVGRESREEYNESHAGIIFMRPSATAPDEEAAEMSALHHEVNLRKFSGWQIRMPQSTGQADLAVQACNYRTTLTTNPENYIPIPKPANYDPYYLRSLETFAGIERVPNDKFGWNRPQLVGLQTAYVEADWAERQRIIDQHWDITMGLLYFLQHDATVPGNVRRAWLEFGLPKDEFADNGHRPYEMYVREARRIVGREIFRQQDAMLAPGLRRAPSHADGIAMTEWYLDSHSCTTARVGGGLEEGKMMLHQETFPGQISYRCLLPQGLDNLLVPVCLSSTHVGWNVVRLEPVFMQTGEAAGLAAAMAQQKRGTVADLDADALTRRLCELGSMVTFFNDMDVQSPEPGIPAAQYFGTKGFFSSYDARLESPLPQSLAEAWADAFSRLDQPGFDPLQACRRVTEAESGEPGPGTTAAGFAALLPGRLRGQRPGHTTLTRGIALRWLWESLPASTQAKPAESTLVSQ